MKQAGIVNGVCASVKLLSMTDDQSTCLVFVFRLCLSEDADIRLKILSEFEHFPSISTQEVTTESKIFVNLTNETSMVEKGGQFLHVNAVERKD